MDRARDRCRPRRLALGGLVLLLAACATIAVRNPPRLDVTAVALDRVEGSDAYFTVDIALTNRMDQPIDIDGLEATLSIEGEQVAQAKLAGGPVHVPASGTANAQMAARTGMDAVLRAVASAMRRGAMLLAPGANPVLRYSLQGSATLAGGGRFPFSKSGEFGERQSAKP
ncbi:MAG TPA: LEA type 2 family protein [Casimicrobiaceae bacterium]|nr:LEA type 2 family protein [Casimicrobiaceae bacterium]